MEEGKRRKRRRRGGRKMNKKKMKKRKGDDESIPVMRCKLRRFLREQRAESRGVGARA